MVTSEVFIQSDAYVFGDTQPTVVEVANEKFTVVWKCAEGLSILNLQQTIELIFNW